MSHPDPALLELFRDEARTHSATLSAGLLQLESDPGNAQRIEPLMRAAHSLKGATRIMGLDLAVKLAHGMEDFLVAAQKGRVSLSPEDIDILLKGTDILASLAEITADRLDAWAEQYQAAVRDLEGRFASRTRGESVPSIMSTPVQPVIEPVPSQTKSSSPGRDSPVSSSQPAASGQPSAPPSPITPSHATRTSGSSRTDTIPSSEPEEEAVVRVTARSLDRLMGLAGESLVQARWLLPFSQSLQRLKKQQDILANTLAAVMEASAEKLPSLLAMAQRQLADCRQELASQTASFEDHSAAAENLNSRLYREVIVSRMRPFGDGTQHLPRLVRDMARTLGKQVRLVIRGETTDVDRDVLEKLEAPLTHLIRNAVDHGIESPQDRQNAGKSEQGTILVEASHRAGMLHVTVSDDGRGIDMDRLRQKIVDRGLSTPELVARMSSDELLQFLFLPGFSTASHVSEFSGRGVGLDVVHDMARRVGGQARITTIPGQGTTFHLQMPITLSVIRAVIVEIAGDPYAFPLTRIDRLLRVSREDVLSVEHRQFITISGQSVGIILASQILELGTDSPPGPTLPVVLITDASGSYGLVVDRFRGEQDLVVRPLPARLGKVPNLSAAAILDDGSPVLILDVEDLIRVTEEYIRTGTLRRCEEPRTRQQQRKRVLIVDDSITVREVERQLLAHKGYEVVVAVDGMDGWNKVRAEGFDLVVTDVDMPRMNGLQLVQAIRDSSSLRSLPVVIVSYKEREEDRLRGLEVGANAYLTKSSFHDNRFIETVEDLIGPAVEGLSSGGG